jgi:hypothetical protein
MKGDARILNGKLHLEKKLLEYVAQYQEGIADVEIKIIDRPAHYLYKYLHGYLLKSMVEFIGDSKESIYSDLKDLFATDKIEEWDDIPRRHRRKAFGKELMDGSKVYTKSASNMTHEELKEFVQNVENHFFEFCQGRIDEKIQDEAREYRKKGFMSAQQLKKYEEGMNVL